MIAGSCGRHLSNPIVDVVVDVVGLLSRREAKPREENPPTEYRVKGRTRPVTYSKSLQSVEEVVRSSRPTLPPLHVR